MSDRVEGTRIEDGEIKLVIDGNEFSLDRDEARFLSRVLLRKSNELWHINP